MCDWKEYHYEVNILHVGKDALQVSTGDMVEYISLISKSFLSYTPFTKWVTRTKTSDRSS